MLSVLAIQLHERGRIVVVLQIGTVANCSWRQKSSQFLLCLALHPATHLPLDLEPPEVRVGLHSRLSLPLASKLLPLVLSLCLRAPTSRF